MLLIQYLNTPTTTVHRVVSVNPLRKRDWAESPDVTSLYEVVHSVPAAQLWHGDEPSELAGLLKREGFELSMVFPLNTGEFRVGAMLVLGLPDEEHITSVLSLLNNLSTIVALVLRNAILYEKQEQTIQERTAELRSNNEKLALELSERKLAEEKLGSQYTLLTALINSPSDIFIFSLDNKYCYTSFNEKHREEMKKVWNADIKVGTNLLKCMHIPELRKLAKVSMDRTLKGEAFSEIQHQPEPDIYYEFSWNPVFQNNNVVGITAFIHDITKRKHSEEQILKLNRIYAVLSNINQAIVRIHDTDELLDEVCRITIEYGNFQMAWIGMVDFQTNIVEVVAWIF